jgi:hypothetical protein
MNNFVFNRYPYLLTSRIFPLEPDKLILELSKSYIETANTVNERIIGIFPTGKPAITGENWYIGTPRRQQSLRQVYAFTSTAAINHGITDYDRFTCCYGSFTDGTNWYGLIFGSNVAIAGQRSFYVTPTQIVFLAGGGAPALTRGQIVLQWLPI